MSKDEILRKIEEKYNDLGIPTESMLEGLLHSKPITYWDYIQTGPLLSLQAQRTTLPDEKVFIMYHQINELLFKMILWEMTQISRKKELTTSFFTSRLGRISRYFDMLTTSFSIMGDGMDAEQYMKFRQTLTPASGFQSAQYRMIEFASTEVINLIDIRFRDKIDKNCSYEHAFEHLYWQAAGKDHETGEKIILLELFEKKYKNRFLRFMEEYHKTNLWSRFKELPEVDKKNVDLVNAMRHYDHTVNVNWVMAHYNTAGKYLNSGDVEIEATGGSHWRKYMHPKYQRRIFFPDLWNEEELKNWGISNLDGCKILTEL
ncbi:tryptophan 2,3-dioxygenase family protein [Urechidicola croceus]|uniref:Tryptophan 2,3-dioxygenase n=1 Tax=Urechidicola croceus TaxID=1850246 RepID=A0A1D8P9U1_9FLAO|nr:tryptophan 2,3-dioxygenase family protein [Urechidicola croceus]AOW21367.1 tryptophan 2,3-dioxygenase [Urechidicola croceus]